MANAIGRRGRLFPHWAALFIIATSAPTALAASAPVASHASTASAAAVAAGGQTLSREQRQQIVDASFNEALLILDRANLVVSDDVRAILYEGLGIGLENILSRTDMLSNKDADAASTAFTQVQTAVGSLIGSALILEKLGGPNGGGLNMQGALILGAGTTSEVLGMATGFVFALGAGAAFGAVINGAYERRHDGSSMGEDLASSLEERQQADLDATVQATRAEAQKREEERAAAAASESGEESSNDTDDDDDASAEQDSDDTCETTEEAPASPGPEGGTPNPDADGPTGSITIATGGEVGDDVQEPSMPGDGVTDPEIGDEPPPSDGIDPVTGEPLTATLPGQGVVDGREPERHSPYLFREDLVSIFVHGRMPLILFTPEMTAQLRAIAGAIR